MPDPARPNDLRRALELLCLKLNPPHEPAIEPIDLDELADGPIDLRGADWKGAYLAGLAVGRSSMAPA